MIEAGKLNRKIKLLKKSATHDSVGEEVVSYIMLASTWAEQRQLSSKDVARQAGTAHAAEVKLLIRYRDDVDLNMRVEHGGQRYELISFEEYGNREGLLLFVRRSDG